MAAGTVEYGEAIECIRDRRISSRHESSHSRSSIAGPSESGLDCRPLSVELVVVVNTSVLPVVASRSLGHSLLLRVLRLHLLGRSIRLLIIVSVGVEPLDVSASSLLLSTLTERIVHSVLSRRNRVGSDGPGIGRGTIGVGSTERTIGSQSLVEISSEGAIPASTEG